MIIKEINWIGTEEAIITVSDGIFNVIAFAYPFFGKAGKKLNKPLLCLDAENIIKVEKEKYSVIKLHNEFKQYFIGKIIDKKNNIVEIGNIKVELDNDFPIDVDTGDYITFRCNRLDLVE